MTWLFHYSYLGSAELSARQGNAYLDKRVSKTLSKKDVEKIKDDVAQDISDKECVKVYPNMIVINNIIKL